jgi:flagellar hook-basal body complex protein FliE
MKIQGLEGSAAIAPATGSAEKGFGGVMSEALAKVDSLQTEADAEATKAARGDGNLHELSLSLEKADVAMRVAVKVRNKLVDAYNEVMRMSV